MSQEEIISKFNAEFFKTKLLTSLLLLSISSLIAQEKEIPPFGEYVPINEFELYIGKWVFDIPEEGNVYVNIYIEDDKLYRKKFAEPEYPRELFNPLHDLVSGKRDGVYYLKYENRIEGDKGKKASLIEKDPIYGTIRYIFYSFKNGKFQKCRVKLLDHVYEGLRIRNTW